MFRDLSEETVGYQGTDQDVKANWVQGRFEVGTSIVAQYLNALVVLIMINETMLK